MTVLNLDGIAAKEIPAVLSGHSADVPIFSCLLSAAVDLELRQDVLPTGELGSLAGDITMVSGIPAKVAAAAEDPAVSAFLYPSLDRDHSLLMLTPNERERIQEALTVASAYVRTVPLKNIADVMEHLFDDDAVTLCSLRQGFWDAAPSSSATETPLGTAIRFLTSHNEDRFWRALESTLSAGDSTRTRQLLDAIVQFHVSRKTYPAGFGGRLFQLVCSLPPATRRLKTPFPLVPVADFITLSQFAAHSHYEDLRFLSRICLENAKAFEPAHFTQRTPATLEDRETGEAAVTILLDELLPETIAAKVCNPIDEALNHFHPDSIQAGSCIECLEVAAALFCQLERYSKAIPAGPPIETAEKEAVALLQEAFARYGGEDAAYAEACQPTRLGGLPYVLKVMTDVYKAKAVHDHIRWVMRKGVDPLYREHVAFTEEIKRRFASFLSPEDVEPDAEVLANRWEDLARAYAHSLDAVKVVLRKR
jgi:hypothetical protein